MKAFLLSAGKGERLLPYTESRPKSLIEAGGKALILWNVEKLRDAGINRLVINLFHKGQQIEDFLGDGSQFGVKINYSYEEELLGTGGGIGKALGILGQEPFLLISSDVWTDFNFSGLSIDPEKLAHLVLVKNPPNKSRGDMFLDGDRVNPKGPGMNVTFSGLAIIRPSLFKRKLEGNYKLWEDVLLPAIERGKVAGEFFQGTLVNINTKEDLEKLDAYLAGE